MRKALNFILILIMMGSLLTGASEEKQEITFKKAKKHVHSKEWKKAVKLFDRLIDSSSEYKAGEALYWKGYSLNKMSTNKSRDTQIDLKKEALESLEDLITNHPGHRWMDDAKVLTVNIAGDLATLGLSRYKNYVDAGARSKKNIELKVAALSAMMNMNSKKAFPILEKIIKTSKHRALRKKAIFIVSQKRDPRVLDLLLYVAKNDKDNKLREEAVFWLSQSNFKSQRLLKEMVELFKNSDNLKLQKKIVFSISQMRLDNKAEAMKSLYKLTDNLALKKNILFWMGQMKDPKATEFIMQILED